MWSDNHLALHIFQTVCIVGDLAWPHDPRSNPRSISLIGHLGNNISATTSQQQPHQPMAGAHTSICACDVMFLYSCNIILVFLDSPSATGSSPISLWQEHAPDLTKFCLVLTQSHNQVPQSPDTIKAPPPCQSTEALSSCFTALIPSRHDWSACLKTRRSAS